MNTPIRGRFAPSPSGRMHLGNLWSCLLAWLAARSAGGGMVLRLEDLDPDRCRPEFCDQVMRDLEWLGLDWDGQPIYQSRRTEAYAAAFRALEDQGLVYPCFCTRAQLHAASAPHREDGLTVYPGTCRGLTPEDIARREAAGRRGALRLRVPEETVTFTDGHLGELTEYLPTDCGDFLLRRSDGLFAYQLAVVVDDAAMGITEVVRGADLLSSTPRQLLLYELLGWEAPEFFHFPLLLSPDGRRLSKRDGDLGLASLRERYTPEEIVGKLAYLAGQNPGGGPRTPEELARGFDWDAVPRQDILLPEGLS